MNRRPRQLLTYPSRSFNGREVVQRLVTIRDLILIDISNNPLGTTAWACARRINARGCTVSSMMYKLARLGVLARSAAKTRHGGWTYRVPVGPRVVDATAHSYKRSYGVGHPV